MHMGRKDFHRRPPPQVNNMCMPVGMQVRTSEAWNSEAAAAEGRDEHAVRAEDKKEAKEAESCASSSSSIP